MKNLKYIAALTAALSLPATGCKEISGEDCDMSGNGENADGPVAALNLCEENRTSYLKCINSDTTTISEISCDGPNRDKLISSVFNTDDYVICKQGDEENPAEITCRPN